MNEYQRMTYLEVMGIQTFVPRWRLPGAGLSRQALLPEAVESGSLPLNEASFGQVFGARADTNTATPAGVEKRPSTPSQPVTGVITGILGDIVSKEVSRAKQQERGTSRAQGIVDALAAPISTETVRFSLSLWRVSESLLVIDTHHARQALPTTALLSNMLFAKGIKTPLPRPDVVRWPMEGAAEGGWLQAGEMIHAFLSARFDRQPVQYVWLMGEAANRAVCPNEAAYSSAIGSVRDLSTFGCLAVVLPSLTEMLQLPSLKAPAWQAIKAHRLV